MNFLRYSGWGIAVPDSVGGKLVLCGHQTWDERRRVGLNHQKLRRLVIRQIGRVVVIEADYTAIGFQPTSTPEPISMGPRCRNKRANKTVRVSSNSLGNVVLPRLFLFLEFAESFGQGEGHFLRSRF